MRVEFHKPSEKRRLCAWTATRGKRTVIPGTVMGVGTSLPHDLAQYVIEAASGYAHGFWGLLSLGATFKSTGRKRTQPGRAVIAEHRDALIASEALAGEHLTSWQRGDETAVTAALDTALAQWQELELGDRLVFEWPSPVGVILRAGPDAGADGPA